MIVDAFIYLAGSIILLLVQIFPKESTLGLDFSGAFDYAGQYVTFLNGIAPLDTMMQCLTLIISIEITVLLFKAIKWMVSYIPIVGGKG